MASTGDENLGYEPEVHISNKGKKHEAIGRLKTELDKQIDIRTHSTTPRPETAIAYIHNNDNMLGNVATASRMPADDKSALIKKERRRFKRYANEQPAKRPEREKGERVRINISGRIFETYQSTLLCKAGSIFELSGILRFFDEDKKEYYFERDSKSFEAILVYMQCGFCEKPEKVPYKIFLEELQYFGFGNLAFKIYKERCEGYQNKKFTEQGLQTTRGYLWHILEYPGLDRVSRGLTLFSTLIIILSTSLACIETVPSIQNSKYRYILNNIQLVCVIWFTLETATRFITCYDKLGFFKNVANLIDIISFLPVYILSATQAKRGVFLSAVLRFFRIMRFVPAFGSPKFLQILKTILLTIRASATEFATFISLIVFAVVLFSCLLYSVEYILCKGSEDFSDVPKIFWFCLVTLSSLGYGDISPTTTGGKIVTVIMFGATILALSLPVPIIVSNFVRTHDTLSKDLTVQTFYFDDTKNKQVEKELMYHSNMNTQKESSSPPCINSEN